VAKFWKLNPLQSYSNMQ